MRVLDVKNLSVSFKSTHKDYITVVHGIDFHVDKGEVLGIVGESGCGKSVTSLSVMGLIPKTQGKVEGEILFGGENLLQKKDREMQRIRGNRIAMIFQDPMTALNPVFTIGNQLIEPFMQHQKLKKKEAAAEAGKMLTQVEIAEPERNMAAYPHQFSGGMRQRVMIAMGLSCKPEILIADEPTTALDVTIQAQVLELMKKMRAELGTAIMLITHDLGVVADIADRIMVMYAGYVVEEAEKFELFKNHKHPYTEGLLKSIPLLTEDRKRLYTIEGTVPSPSSPISGCPFHTRCPYCTDRCKEELPPMREISPKHFVRCFKED